MNWIRALGALAMVVAYVFVVPGLPYCQPGVAARRGLFLLPPYLIVLALVRSGPAEDGRAVKAALALGAGWSALMTVATSAAAAQGAHSSLGGISALAMALTHGPWGWLCARELVRRAPGHEAEARACRRLAYAIGLFVLPLGLVVGAVYFRSLDRARSNESAVVALLRDFDDVVKEYVTRCARVPRALDELGPAPSGEKPSCVAMGLLPSAWSGRGKEHYGYAFDYRAPPTAAGPNAAWAVTARPIGARSGCRSYYVDQTGVVRSTAGERAPTATDPALD